MKQRLSDAGVARLKGENEEEEKRREEEETKERGAAERYQINAPITRVTAAANSGSSSLDPPSAPTFLSSTSRL